MQFLKEQNCDEIQGFFLSKPLPPEELVRLIKDRDRILPSEGNTNGAIGRLG